MFGNTDKKEKPNINNNEQTIINKPSSSRLPLTSCQINSCSENNSRNLDTNENSSSVQESLQICRSLVSPKTLLKATTTPLWGQNQSKSVKKEPVANLSSSVIINCTSSHSNSSNSLVLCSTTVACLSNPPQTKQLSETGATVGLVEEEEGGELLVEIEERCGSYDDVVLERDDVTDGEYISAFDSGCYMWEEPHNSHSTTDLFTLRDSMGADNISKTEMMTSELSTTSVSTKMTTSHVNISNQSAKMRQHPLVSEPNAYLAVNKTVTCYKTNLQKTGLQFHKTSDGPPKNFKPNSPSSFRPKSFVPEKTSTPNASFARPKPVTSHHIKHKQAPKSSFTIYTDPAKKAATPSFPASCISKNVLSTLSTNTLSSSSCSSLPVKLKEGGKITSPLCACGRRAKRQVVSNGGPNHGRGFYSCPVRQSGSRGRIQKGCEFFKWESSLMKSSTVVSPSVRSSVSLCHINSTLNRCPQQSSTLRKSY